MSWPFDTSEPFVSPALMSEHARQAAGVSEEEWKLPRIMVATFQREAYNRLLQRAGVDLVSAGSRAVGSVEGTYVVVERITIGAPATSIVLEENIARGVEEILIVGSAGSLQPSLPLGSTVIVTGAEREDGTSHHYLPAGEQVCANAELSDLLARSAEARGLSPVRGRSWTIDAPYRETVGAIRRHRDAGVLVVEMEAAAIFAIAQVRGVRAGLIIAVSDELFGHEWNRGFGHTSYLKALGMAAEAVMDAAVELGRSNAG